MIQNGEADHREAGNAAAESLGAFKDDGHDSEDDEDKTHANETIADGEDTDNREAENAAAESLGAFEAHKSSHQPRPKSDEVTHEPKWRNERELLEDFVQNRNGPEKTSLNPHNAQLQQKSSNSPSNPNMGLDNMYQLIMKRRESQRRSNRTPKSPDKAERLAARLHGDAEQTLQRLKENHPRPPLKKIRPGKVLNPELQQEQNEKNKRLPASSSVGAVRRNSKAPPEAKGTSQNTEALHDPSRPPISTKHLGVDGKENYEGSFILKKPIDSAKATGSERKNPYSVSTMVTEERSSSSSNGASKMEELSEGCMSKAPGSGGGETEDATDDLPGFEEAPASGTISASDQAATKEGHHEKSTEDVDAAN